MGLTWVWLWLILLLVSFEGCWVQGCLEPEKFALLQLKHFFNNPNSLRNWVDGDCCQWEKVKCNSTTGRVIELDLSYARKREPGEWYLNVSLFSSFKQLESLYLLFNHIAGCVENEGFERLSHLNNLAILDLSFNKLNDSNILSTLNRHSSLKSVSLQYNRLGELNRITGSSNLEVLDLSGNIFNNSIFSSLAGLSSLRTLNLNFNSLNGIVDVQELYSLSNLEELDLSYNAIDKFVFPKGNRGWRNLKILYLSNVNAKAGTTLLQSLGSFSSLKTLYLQYNNFSGIVTTREFHNLTNIEELFLDASSLHISLLQSIAAITSLKNLSMEFCEVNGNLHGQDLPIFNHLRYLYMDSSPLNNSFLQIIWTMTSLETLSLVYCGLNGTLLDHQDLCKLVNLRVLDISHNGFGGTLPWCLANLTSLQELDISSNHFVGNISLSPLTVLTTIQNITLSNNYFQIPISLKPFFNHSKLKNFYGRNNEIYGEIESDSLAPKFQLNSVILSGYGDGGSFPKFLYHQLDLEIVELSHIHLKGNFPNWLLENNTKLNRLYLVNNSLSGPLQLPNLVHMHLKELDISINSFNGHIPIEVGTYLPNLDSLNLSQNAFIGSIPSSFGVMNGLRSLDLSNNLLYGKIPEELAMHCFSLQLLVLSNNSLHGQIFSANFNLTNLLSLQLDNNNFTGKIPESLSNCSLRGIYISDNHISSRIPHWLGKMSDLEDIIMPNNHLEGPIPLEFCQLDKLVALDLSENNITESLPFCFHPSSIKQVHLSRNNLQGQIKDAFANSSSLVTLDIGYNHFNGYIPNWIGRLPDLTYLILTHNNLEGEVPTHLCQLDQLRLMDLSHNNLSGHIPPCLFITTASTSTSSLPNDSITIPMRKEETVEFTTKNITYSYHGKVLTYMSGIDLSCNKLIGDIPYQIGNLMGIHTLNISHNNLTGPIPPTFSNLKQIESLDLSFNNLNGRIPPQLVDLTTLAVFSVAYNNLSGKIPERIAQFATFEEGSYEGNPLLCGEPLPKSCNVIDSPSSRTRDSTINREDSFIDMYFFCISFMVSYIIMLLGIIIVFYINPYWRRTWFYLVEMWMTSCYYFVIDHFK